MAISRNKAGTGGKFASGQIYGPGKGAGSDSDTVGCLEVIE